MVIGQGSPDRFLNDGEIRAIVEEALASLQVDGKRVLIIIPDGTRTMPMPRMFDLFEELLEPRAASLDYLVALGTHPPMTDAQISRLVGRTSELQQLEAALDDASPRASNWLRSALDAIVERERRAKRPLPNDDPGERRPRERHHLAHLRFRRHAPAHDHPSGRSRGLGRAGPRRACGPQWPGGHGRARAAGARARHRAPRHDFARGCAWRLPPRDDSA